MSRRGSRSKILRQYISVSVEMEMEIERDKYAAATQGDSQYEIWRWRNFVNLCSRNSYKAPCDGCTPIDCNTKRWFGESFLVGMTVCAFGVSPHALSTLIGMLSQDEKWKQADCLRAQMVHQRKKNKAFTPPKKMKARLPTPSDMTTGTTATSRHPVSASAAIISAGRRKRRREDQYGLVPTTICEIGAAASTIVDARASIVERATGGGDGCDATSPSHATRR